MGVSQLFAHIGLVACMLLCPQLAISKGLIYAVSFGIFLNVAVFFFGVGSILID